jgi:hypothetical protein
MAMKRHHVMTRSPDQLDDLTDRWHAGEGGGQSLREFLGMSRIEYAAYVLHGIVPGSRVLSRNLREGQFMGHSSGKAVRHWAPFVQRPCSAFARGFHRGQLLRRSGVSFEVTHLADQQGVK